MHAQFPEFSETLVFKARCLQFATVGPNCLTSEACFRSTWFETDEERLQSRR